MNIIFLIITLTQLQFLNDIACKYLNEKDIPFIEILEAFRKNRIFYTSLEQTVITLEGSYLTAKDIKRAIKRTVKNPSNTVYGICVAGNHGKGIMVQTFNSLTLERIERTKKEIVIFLKPKKSEAEKVKIVRESLTEECDYQTLEIKNSIVVSLSPDTAKVEIISVRGHSEHPEIIIPFKKEPISRLPKKKTKDPVKRLLELINSERKKRGLNEVKLSRKLSRVAKAHSKDMAEHHFFSHYSPRTGTPAERAKRLKIKFQKITENIGMGDSVEEIHFLLMDSPIHKCNIIDPEVEFVGIGVVNIKNDYILVTENFIKPAQ